ncbi:DnaA/Hda family protein [Mycoplasmopsis ciconiae]|uniref:Chromosomal replication initiator protein DnaA n=1 Tax=Mycoplasmopsis ciconiae TaxID=561067 RepID=A0ABU7MMQ5_9BACT|nr:DnaA/Hda family protein [Mycoplasmopsis ciconiae]
MYSDLQNKNLLNKFKKELNIELNDSMIFKTFFNKCQLIDLKDNILTIYLPLAFNLFKSFNKKEYETQIKNAIFNTFEQKYDFELTNKDENNQINQSDFENTKNIREIPINIIEFPNLKDFKINLDEPKLKKATKSKKLSDSLTKNNDSSQKITFENLIKSNFNYEAIEMARALSLNLLNANPLYISGSSGNGKTQILLALKNHFTKNNHESYLLNSNNFFRDVVVLLADNNQEKLIKMYNGLSSVELLIIDDFQIFTKGNKKSSVDFLFQIIDERITKNKPTVIACELPLEKIKNYFDNRVITRLAGGIQTSIKNPNNNDFLFILNHLLDINGINNELLDKETKDFIIRNHKQSISTLQGSINRLSYYKKEIKETKNVHNLVMNIFKDVVKDKKNITPEMVIETISKYYKISKKEILGKSRKKEIVLSRHIAIVLLRNHLNMTLTQIGTFFNRDHTTILSALKKIDSLKNDTSINRTLKFFEEELYRMK